MVFDATSCESTNRRRSDIQGLRAVAVLMVIAFHSGLPIAGGFVGVDVFFVISGFVITGMLQREWAASGQIRFGQFYLRRFKRLTPALSMMVSLTILISVVVLFPFGEQQFAAQTGIAAMLLVANFVIAATTGGYFAPAADSNPLLNTWSLSVEEQFYLVFPFVLMAGWAISARWTWTRWTAMALVSLVGVASLALAITTSLGTQVPLVPSSLIGFYGPLGRVWEFAAGSALSLALTHAKVPSRAWTSTIGLAGVILLAVSMLAITGESAYPGFSTLLPVLGTVLLLLAGQNSSNLVSRGLATSPMISIGDWSYSIYLWHWPLIVFAGLLWPTHEIALMIAAAASLAPALASYYWIEAPIRNLVTRSKGRMWALVLSILLIPILLAAVLGFTAKNYLKTNFPVAHQGDVGNEEFDTFVKDRSFPCLSQVAGKLEPMVGCLHQSLPNADVEIALLGDSHAQTLFAGLVLSLPNSNVAVYSYMAGDETEHLIDQVAESPTINTVIINLYWLGRGVTSFDLTRDLRKLVKAGKRVLVTDDIPDFPVDATACKYRRALVFSPECSQDAMAFWHRYETFIPELRESLVQVPQVELVMTAGYMCGPATCDMTLGEKLIYRDNDHLNLDGARYLADRLLQDYPNITTARAHLD